MVKRFGFDLLEVVGMGLIVYAAFLSDVRLGWLTAGAALVLAANLGDRQ